MRPVIIIWGVALALVATSHAPARAQDAAAEPRPFCADRPGLGTPPCVLDAGRWQLEGGVSGVVDRSGAVETREWSYGDFELRVGLTPTLEGQVYWTPYATVRERAGGAVSRAHGSGDVTLAVRRSLRNPDGEGLSIAVQPFVTAPTGADGIGSGAWQGGVIVPVSAPLPGGLSLGLAPEIDMAADADGAGHHLALAAVVGVAGEVGEVGWGVELWGAVDDDPLGRTTQAALSLSVGWTPAGLADTQFDVGVDLGLNRETPDVAFGVGIARRF